MAQNPETSTATAQAYAAGNIDGLNEAWTRRLIASVVDTESSGGNLRADNGVGYYGRYQGGAAWLADAGVVNKDKYNAALKASGFDNDWDWGLSGGAQRFLKDSSNWNNGLSLEKYLSSAEIQDKAFKTNSSASYNNAVRDGVLTPDTDPAVIAGFMKARHLGGQGAAEDVLRGGSGVKDANGTSTLDYFNDIVRNRDGLGERFVGNHVPSQTTVTPNPLADNVLREGERGDAVKLLQKALNEKNGASLDVDGNFGSGTKAALEDYQRKHNLTPDGIAGPQTLKSLGIDVNQQTSQQASSPQNPQTTVPKETAPQPPQQAPNDLAWPVPGKYKINESDKSDREGDGHFGSRRGETGSHAGIDIQGNIGDPIVAMKSGTVVYAGNSMDPNGYGNSIMIDHGNGTATFYAHLSGIDVKPGQEVKAGEKIGALGADGNAASLVASGQGDPHLHFEVIQGFNRDNLNSGKAVDPTTILAPVSNGQTQSQSQTTPSPATPSQGSSRNDGLLKEGDSGDGVRHLQENLRKMGYPDGTNGKPLDADGKFGPETRRAVETFQRVNGLDVDGVAGPKTLAAVSASVVVASVPEAKQTTATQHPSSADPVATSQTQPAAKPDQQSTPPVAKPDAQPTPTDKPQTPANVQPTPTDKPQTPPSSNTTVPPPTQTDKPLMSNPNHPDNKLYQQAVSNLEQLGPSGGFKSRDDLEKAAAAVAADAKATGLKEIDHISKTNAPNGQSYLVAVQGDPTSPASKNSYIDYNQATSQTVAQSTQMAEAQKQATPAVPTADQQRGQDNSDPKPKTMLA